jgi:hypothetical protein
MRVLERSLAFEQAQQFAESVSNPVEPEGADDARDWFDLTDSSRAEDEAHLLDEALEYLTWRGLLLRHDANPNIIAIRDEHEAEVKQ